MKRLGEKWGLAQEVTEGVTTEKEAIKKLKDAGFSDDEMEEVLLEYDIEHHNEYDWEAIKGEQRE